MEPSTEPKPDIDLTTGDIWERSQALSLLREAVAIYGGSASALARAAGVSASTITRPMKDPRGAPVPKWATLAKIAAAAKLGISQPGRALKLPTALQIVDIVGEIRPGVWFEDADRPFGDPLILSFGSRPIGGTLAGYLVGPDGEPGFDPGSRLIVDQDLRPTSGDRVVLRRFKGDLIETTLHLFQDGRLHSGAASRVAPADLFEGGNHESAETVGIFMGTVVGSVWLR